MNTGQLLCRLTEWQTSGKACHTILRVVANLDFLMPDVGQRLVRARMLLCNRLIL